MISKLINWAIWTLENCLSNFGGIHFRLISTLLGRIRYQRRKDLKKLVFCYNEIEIVDRFLKTPIRSGEILLSHCKILFVFKTFFCVTITVPSVSVSFKRFLNYLQMSVVVRLYGGGSEGSLKKKDFFKI